MGTALSPLEEVKLNLTRMQGDFKMVLPPNIQPEKFMRVVITAIQNNPDLIAANRASLYNSCIKCAQDGLIPDGQEATLTVFKGMVVYMPMIRGILKKVRNSGELSTVDAQVVYSNDEYESWLDEKGQHFKHKKMLINRGDPVLTYAYALTKDGGLYFEEVSEEQMEKIEGIAKTGVVWKGAFRDEMKRKSALRRLSKRLPMSTDLQTIIERDDELYELPEGPSAPAKPTSSRLDNIVDAQTVPQDPVPPLAETQVVDPKPDNGTVEGLIEDCKVKNGTANNKPWTKYGVKIAECWYNTFDKKIYEACLEFKKNRVLCHVEYRQTDYGPEFISIRSMVADNNGLPI